MKADIIDQSKVAHGLNEMLKEALKTTELWGNKVHAVPSPEEMAAAEAEIKNDSFWEESLLSNLAAEFQTDRN